MSNYQSCSSGEACKDHETSEFDKFLNPKNSDSIPAPETFVPRQATCDNGFVYESPIIDGVHNIPGNDAWNLKLNGVNQ